MMINPVNEVSLINPLESKYGIAENNNSFASLLKNKIEEVNNLQLKADEITQDFITGKTDNIHQVMIAGTKAEIAMNLTLAMQNKVIDAYKEIMRIQV